MSFVSDYNFLERTLHYVAFSSPFIQNVLSELEDDMFGQSLAEATSDNEVFVTGLPRSGTTLLLELLFATGEFTTFTYRQMPFVMAPLLWDRLSRTFRKRSVEKERAHGDGMSVSFDSPEAFEEVIWLAHLRRAIEKNESLSPLTLADCGPHFPPKLRQAITKLVRLDMTASGSPRPRRYLSKNNANLSRLNALRSIFPSAVILIPFRRPAAHVGSMMKQHKRFCTVHRQDRFSRRYMKWIGHFEFGENFKPINFDGWLDDGARISGENPDFWLRYWIAAYRHVLSQRDQGVYLVDYDRLLTNGAEALARIARHARLSHPNALIAGASALRAPTTRDDEIPRFSGAIVDEAESLHRELVHASEPLVAIE